MKKWMLIALIFSILSPVLSGQTKPRKINRIALQVDGGANFGWKIQSTDDDNISPGFTFGAELRYNLRRIPLDFGIRYTNSYFMISDGECGLGYLTMSFLAIGDYNLSQGRLVNPFVGVGAGLGWGIYSGGYSCFCLAPRVGVRLLRHISLALDCQWYLGQLRMMNLTGGIYF